MTALLLAVVIGLICVVLFVFLKQRLFSPAIAFTAPFAVSALILLLNVEKWEVDLSWTTFLVILIGIVFFLAGVFVADRIFSGGEEAKKSDIQYIAINKKFMLVIGALEAVIAVVCFFAIIRVAEANGITGGVMAKISGYKELGTFTTENVDLGGIVDWLYIFNVAAGFVWAFILANNVAAVKKIDKLALINFMISAATSIEKGGRQALVQLGCALVVMTLILLAIKNGEKMTEWVRQRKLKLFIVGCVVLVVVAFGFQGVAKGLGRTKSMNDPFQYFSVYMSGELNNLDIFMKNFDKWETPSVVGKMTFINAHRYFGSKFNDVNLRYTLDLPFRSANNYNTGNVYTTFYAFLYDFGYIGLIVLPLIMGLISQILYLKCFAKRSSKKSPISVVMILYSYVFYMILFSFFSNKFYEGVINLSMVKYLMVWFGLAAVLNLSHRRTMKKYEEYRKIAEMPKDVKKISH